MTQQLPPSTGGTWHTVDMQLFDDERLRHGDL